MDQVMKVEQMRKAILEGIKTDVFAKPNLPMLGQYGPGGPMYPPGKIFSNSRVIEQVLSFQRLIETHT